MASPTAGGGKRVHNLPYSSDVNQSRNSLILLTMPIFINFSLSDCDLSFFGYIPVQQISGSGIQEDWAM